MQKNDKPVSGVIVACRMGSTRLPEKALLPLDGIASIERCLLNAAESSISSKTILATSTNPENDVLEKHTLSGKVKFFRGSEEDMADRLLSAAKEHGIDYIVRVTGDSPVVSYELIDVLLDSHHKTFADYSCFTDAPLGVKSEVISTKAIEKLAQLIDTSKHSEYLTLYFKNNPKHFSINEIPVPQEYKSDNYRLNLDYREDYEVLTKVFDALKPGSSPVALVSVLHFMRNHPEVAAINSHIVPKYKSGQLADFLEQITVIPN